MIDQTTQEQLDNAMGIVAVHARDIIEFRKIHECSMAEALSHLTNENIHMLLRTEDFIVDPLAAIQVALLKLTDIQYPKFKGVK